MRKYFFLCALFLFGIQTNATVDNDNFVKIEEQAPHVDEVTTAKLKSSFKVSKDDFSDKVWVHHKNDPKNRWRNAIYMYFQLENGNPTNPRLVIQYVGRDWLFINQYTINIDGKNYDFKPSELERDHNELEIWEWCDETLLDNEKLIKAIAEGTKIKIRYHGQQYYDDITIADKYVKAIKDAYEYYKALGGTF